MAKAKRGMDAVISKSAGMGRPKKAAFKRKGGPGVAIMIAVGKPKPMIPDDKGMKDELDASKGDGMPKAEKIAALEEKIAYLKAELALLKGESEDEMDEEMEDEGESEDEYEDDED